MDYFFEGNLRLDWGLGNPNTAAAIIAGISVGVWILAGIWQKSKLWFTCVSLLFFYSGMLLLDTYSRGGIVAALVGLIPVSLWIWRQRSMYEKLIFLTALGGLATYSKVNDMSKRVSADFVAQDKSIANRMIIYKQVPRMLADNPHGWGLGNAGKVYGQYYQDPKHLSNYRNLVNYHATILVELPWWARCLYVSAWALASTLVWSPGWLSKPQLLATIPIVSSGVVLTFFMAGCFSTVGEKWQAWLPIAVALLITIIWRLCRKKKLDKLFLYYSLLSFNCILWLLCLYGELMPHKDSILAPDKERIILQSRRN